ncbi:MAG: hypothetical protein JKY34_07750 [Kordiimonadaceae bacterium]|nr:hypothetical protein [Kordiimonadaceae bacterium]
MTKKYLNGELLDLSTDEQTAFDAAELTAETNRLPIWRSTASLSRTDFCIALKRAGVLPAGEAVQAARGEWPETFSDALASYSDSEEAEIVWAGTEVVLRSSSLLESLRLDASLTLEELDALFGWTP